MKKIASKKDSNRVRHAGKQARSLLRASAGSAPKGETTTDAESEVPRSGRSELDSACLAMRQTLIEECQSKHQCDPREADLNEDYHTEVTLSIGEIRRFISAVDKALKHNHAMMCACPLCQVRRKQNAAWNKETKENR